MTRQHHFPQLFALLAALTFSACVTGPVDPEGYDGATGGCSNFLVYRYNADATEALVVSARRDSLDLTTTPRTITLPSSALTLHVDRFEAPAPHYYCNDVILPGYRVVTTWTAVSGRVRISATEPDMTQPFGSQTYQVTVMIEEATLRNDQGETITVDAIDLGTITVGWLPG